MSLPKLSKTTSDSEYVYEDGNTLALVCPECADERDPCRSCSRRTCGSAVDSNGTRLADGDTVRVIKDLKVKGAPKDIKQGTRVKNIRLVEA